MEILQHFEREDSPLITYTLKTKDWDELRQKLPPECELCYVSQGQLEDMILELSLMKQEVLKEYFVPQKGSVRSGDFGEMLSYFMTKEKFDKAGKSVKGPKKWRFLKRNPDEAGSGVDVILFYRTDDKMPKATDLLITVESKMRATAQHPNTNVIQTAVTGADTDCNSRMAKSLELLRIQYGKRRKLNKLKALERWRKPDEHGSFTHIAKAFAIVSSDLLENELKKPLETKDGIQIILVSIERLQELYEAVLNSLTESSSTNA